MSVFIETNIGNVTIDVYVDDVPETSKNFLKLCALKYYNNVLFFNVQADFIAQTGDPTGTGQGGSSIYGYALRCFPWDSLLIRQFMMDFRMNSADCWKVRRSVL